MTETTNMPSLLMCGTGIGREGKRPIGMGLSVGTAETDASQSWISALSQALQPFVQPGEASGDGFRQAIVGAQEVRSGDERSHTTQQTARRKGDGLTHLMTGFAMQPMMSSVQGQIQIESEETTSGESRQNQAEDGSEFLVSNRKQEPSGQLLTPDSMKLTHGSEPMSGTLSLFAKPSLVNDTEWKDRNLPGNVDLHTFSRDGVSVAMISSVDETPRTSLQTLVKPPMGVIPETSVVGELPSDEFQSLEIDTNRDEVLWVPEDTSFGTRVHSKMSMDEGGADESVAKGTNSSISTSLEAEMPANLVRNASDKPIHRSSQQVDVVEMRAFERPPHVNDSGTKIATEGNAVSSNRITEQTTHSGYSSTTSSPASSLDGTEWRAAPIEAEQRVLSSSPAEGSVSNPRIEPEKAQPQKSQLLDSGHDSSERNISFKHMNRLSQQVDVVEMRAFERPPHVNDSGTKIATEGNAVSSNRITEQTTHSGYSSTTSSPASSLDGTEWRAAPIEAEQRVLSSSPAEGSVSNPRIEPEKAQPQKSQLLDSYIDPVERFGSPLTERPIASGSEKQASTEGRTDDSEDGLQQMKTVHSVERKGSTAGKVFIPTFGSTESALKSHAIVPGKQADRISRQFDGEGIRSTIANAVLKHSTGSTEIQMSLKPEWLGSMTMRIQSEEGKLQIHIVTEHQTTRDILEAQVQSLRSEMEGKGLVIEKIQVDLSGSRNDGQVGTGVGQWTSYQQQRENGTFFAFEPDEKPITDKQEVTYESTMEPMPKGRLNAFA